MVAATAGESAPARHRHAAATTARRDADAAALAAAITSRLNPEQARAVTTTRGPLLILAGAGSGKTRVLAHRIAYLVGVEGVPPWQILAVTFTNKAAAEMRERILALVGDEGRQVAMGTFHALCARVLRRDGAAIGIDPRFTIYDTDDQTGIVKQVLRDLELRGGTELRPAAVLSAISRWKNDLVSPLEADEAARGFLEAQMARAYTRYAKRLREASALDFDDLLIEAVRLFEQAPAVLAHYRNRWRYLHVDEYQDTNRAQYLWVKLLAAEHRNVAVVGDDDQSIYSWRGADLRNILDFEQDYPEATVVKLEQNYRSTQLILDAAHAVVERNEGRKDKKLWTQNPRGALIERFEADREDEEAEWVARQVEALVAGRGAPAPCWPAGPMTATTTSTASRTSPSCTARTPRAGPSRKPSCATACATSWWAARASTSAARSRTPWPTCACCATITTWRPSSASSTCRRAASASARWRCFAS